MIRHLVSGLVVVGALAAAIAAEPEAIVAPTAEDQALAARALVVIQAGRETAARESMNLAAHRWPAPALQMLQGATPATASQLASARNVVAQLVGLAQKGQAWPRLVPIAVPRAAGPIHIDGEANEPAWQKSWASSTLYWYDHPEPLEKPGTRWRLLWDEQNLYVAFECDDSEIVSKDRPRDDAVYMDDCVEIFLHTAAVPQQYWELVINPTGSVFDALHTKKMDDWGPQPGGPAATMKGLQFATKIRRDPATGATRGYTTEVAVPLAQLPGFVTDRPPRAGDKFYGVLARLDVNDGKMKAYACVPLLNWGHNIWNHVPLVLAP